METVGTFILTPKILKETLGSLSGPEPEIKPYSMVVFYFMISYSFCPVTVCLQIHGFTSNKFKYLSLHDMMTS